MTTQAMNASLVVSASSLVHCPTSLGWLLLELQLQLFHNRCGQTAILELDLASRASGCRASIRFLLGSFQLICLKFELLLLEQFLFRLLINDRLLLCRLRLVSF